MKDDIVADYLREILEELQDNSEGEVADYIQELADADPEPFSVALCTTDGQIYAQGLHEGDVELEFTIQSMSKPFAYALALEEHTLKKVARYVGMEPSGEAFNELSLEGETKRPMNPMINAGAITVNQLINGEESLVEDRVEKILAFFSDLADRELTIDQSTCDSELATSDRNMSIAHMLRSYDMIRDEAHDAIDSYVQQCSIKVTVSDLAMMAATLANGGEQPRSGKQVCSKEVALQVQAVMASAGMYNGAGRWMAQVGIPAKSGVSGGIIGTLPGRMGIAAFSPKLNPNGNSVRARRVFQYLSRDMGLHLMAAEKRGRVAVRNISTVEDAAADQGIKTIIRLQGDIDFNAGEKIWRTVREHEFASKSVVVDLDKVDEVNEVGGRMLRELHDHFVDHGYKVELVDNDGVLGPE